MCNKKHHMCIYKLSKYVLCDFITCPSKVLWILYHALLHMLHDKGYCHTYSYCALLQAMFDQEVIDLYIENVPRYITIHYCGVQLKCE